MSETKTGKIIDFATAVKALPEKLEEDRVRPVVTINGRLNSSYRINIGEGIIIPLEISNPLKDEEVEFIIATTNDKKVLVERKGSTFSIKALEAGDLSLRVFPVYKSDPTVTGDPNIDNPLYIDLHINT